MSEPRPLPDVVISTELADSAKLRARQILSQTPVIALPHGGMGKKVETDADLLDNLEHIVGSLRYWMAQHEEAADELATIKRDLKAARRVLKLITEDQE